MSIDNKKPFQEKFDAEKIISFIDSHQENFFTLLKKLTKIPSPTFFEKNKILFLKDQLSNLGINSWIDNVGNLNGKLITGRSKRKKILTIAHVDTVLTSLGVVKESKERIYGHGICDNSTGVVSLFSFLKYINKDQMNFPNDLYFSFTVREEGLGCKEGIKEVLKKEKNIHAVVNLESHNVGRIVNQTPGQLRIRLSIESKLGGHSFRSFGNPSAIVIASKIICEFSSITEFKKNHTTYNIGQITGGEGINTIARLALITLEIRSTDQAKIVMLLDKLKFIIQNLTQTGISIRLTTLSNTSAALLDKKHNIYKLTRDIHKYLGIKTFYETGNNDGDISLSLSIPTVTLGSSVGDYTHTLEEYVEKRSFILGLKQNFMVILNMLYNY